MSNFSIFFHPPLPSVEIKTTDLSLEALNVRLVLDKYPVYHSIVYTIDGAKFEYYPASVITVLNDLHLELKMLEERRSHHMTLSGYTVLEVRYQNEMAQFYDPLGPATVGKEVWVGKDIPCEAIEMEFMRATLEVVNLVRAI